MTNTLTYFYQTCVQEKLLPGAHLKRTDDILKKYKIHTCI